MDFTGFWLIPIPPIAALIAKILGGF